MDARSAVFPVGVQTKPARGSKLVPRLPKLLKYPASE
jgi:hypothetical protein